MSTPNAHTTPGALQERSPGENEIRKTRKARVTKVKRSERGFRPSLKATPLPEIKSFTTFIRIEIPAPGHHIGTTEQSETLYGFAARLDAQAQTDAVGSVTKFGVDESTWECVLGLHAIEGKDINGLASNAFEKLNSFLSNEADILTGKAPSLGLATWQIKVKDYVVDEGQF
ncbi:hypothetical protein [uncultured Zoogloea sp.]|uniref:hypothetical protein n=1 Tax=uncultured Zoogloea sp. TaxID=160237 RepID=UPI00262DCDF0|nr:hypothetical protein [uncultured Zoogloea sp.]